VNERPTDTNDATDRDLDAAWRRRSKEAPPGSVDDAIRAAARRAIASGTTETASAQSRWAVRRDWRRDWRPLAAAAAVATLAFGLLRWLPRDTHLAPARPQTSPTSESSAPVVADERGPAEAPNWRADDAAKSVLDSLPADGSQLRLKGAPAVQPGARPPQTPAPAAEAPVAAGQSSGLANSTDAIPATPGPAAPQRRDSVSELEAAHVSGAQEEQKPKTTAKVTAATGVVAAPVAAAEPEQREPAAWVHEIEALHAAGYDDRAAAQLRKFRASYRNADEFLPDALRSWAASVKD
jgi:hypothetical protein